MAQSRELTGHGNQASPPGPSLWVREADVRWSFWWRGAVPMLALAGVLAYGMSAFAHKTATQVRLSVTDELSKQGLGWVQVQADGQHVRLGGKPPSRDAGARAVTAATKATCQSWLGSFTCTRAVTSHFDASNANGVGAEQPDADSPKALRELNNTSNAAVALPQAVETVAPGLTGAEPTPGNVAPGDVAPGTVASTAAPTVVPAAGIAAGQRWFDLKVVRTGNALKLKGDVANEAVRGALESTARTHFPSGTLDNQLTVVGGDVSPEWERAATHAIEVATRCEQGVVSLSNATINVDCETQTVAAKQAIHALVNQQLPGLGSGAVSVLALDEVKSCEAGLVKLVTRSQIRFTTSSAKLLPTSRPLLREIAHQLERCPGVVVIEGHTDAQGVREENITLSLNRARAVVSGLVGLGVPAPRVRAEGFGPDQPLATNATATGRAQNRRIEFRVARTGVRGE